MTRSHGKAIKDFISQVVHIESPDVKSPANLILLSREYFSLDKSIYSNCRMKNIQRRWMKRQLKMSSEGLACNICGKKGLNPHHPIEQEKATIDHIIDISKGGAWNDPSNFQIACYRCNQLKSNGSLQRA